jgi:hypothetical protein
MLDAERGQCSEPKHNYASDEEKMQRLAEHLEWAERHGRLTALAGFLRNLNETDWHHVGD